jgi:cytochrome P450
VHSLDKLPQLADGAEEAVGRGRARIDQSVARMEIQIALSTLLDRFELAGTPVRRPTFTRAEALPVALD